MTTTAMSESVVEAAALGWFEELGYAALHGPDIARGETAAERLDFAETVLRQRLQEVMARLNPRIPAPALEEALRKITWAETPSLIENNRRFHRLLTDGVDVEYRRADGSIAGDKVWLFDFEHLDWNDWLVVSQFTVIENKHNRRADLVVFVNGIPLAVVELKNPGDENATVKGAFNQLQTYKKDIPGFFTFNEVMVISDGLDARVGTMTSDWERFMPWRTIDGEDVAPLHTPQLEV